MGSRTGDTPADARRQLVRNPPDILVTTPESLYLLLTSQAREILRGVEHVIVDEVHAMAATKRGAHLALSLERLSHLADADPQRIGLSATQRPLSAIAAFVGGVGREVEIVDAGARKELDLEVIVPVDDMTRIDDRHGARSRPGRAALHLAEHPPTTAGAHPGASVNADLRELEAAGRAACRAPQRAGRRGARQGASRQHRP